MINGRTDAHKLHGAWERAESFLAFQIWRRAIRKVVCYSCMRVLLNEPF